jgi:hypothetical protein
MGSYVIDLGGAQESLHAGRDNADLVKDLLRGSRPLEWLAITIPDA